MLLRDDEKQGLEGQCLVKKDGYYYLFYSIGNCCGDRCSYKVHVARSSSLQGPYSKFENNPILSETKDWKCTGHGTIVKSEAGKDFYMYHAYSKANDVYTGRQGMLGELNWNLHTGWPDIKPLGEKANPVKNFEDEFLQTDLSYAWQWDFRNSKPNLKVQNGNLTLSGRTPENNLTGTALTVRPLAGDYEITTEVVNENASLKGLVLYGDAGQALGIGIKNNMIQIWEVKDKERTVLTEVTVKTGKPLELKMKVDNGYQCRFYWNEGQNWKELKLTTEFLNGDFLPPWDRTPRPGLIYLGAEAEPAVFSSFQIIYTSR
jgi:beta-xylosidase